ncbi:MAG: cupin domain-containing protein [Chloroflexi bacterium]|nr:cupin domain-containing protein [Chloroflexota bacterium]
MDKVRIFDLKDAPLKELPFHVMSRTIINERVGNVHLRLGIGECAPGVESDEHARTWDEVVYYISGEPILEISDGPTYKLGPGNLIVVPRGLKHRHRNVGKEKLVQLFLQAEPAEG